ncbi:MAG: LysR family transcriptional regulator [Acetobacter fabarum]|jgi:LysR family transcriptional regulator for metE and metH|uniref:LysR family transcriptional regulator n=1 Tax=Acetobacter fabarum TaxID=483199 RepID=UPI00242D8324|nr:LysR family transcriptional regulator [Acetobacter fabarum]MCH4026500.1 LysR family transcriptional regulator [Acetobacter fabarum]MCH4085638.1 LysR family transcriptional regulator [Acetobacter fabarum]MCH4137119.1 LysR family transcriptional regulator [Acetobacter fabarum]MCI1322380.1 LysR family transcriptional regulator [Acetobacter fabarum]
MGILERSHLAIIQAVAREGSLTAAGMRLNLTQPALSHAIRKIESQLDVKIWRREGRSLVLTQAGEWLLSLANRMLPQFELAEKRLEQFANGERGTLRIGMECHPCYQWLLKVVSPYLEQWPKVDVDVRQKFQFGGIGALFSNEIDILVTPDPLYKPGLKFTPVFDYELVLVVGPQHHLRNTKFILPEQLAGETLITYPVPPERLDIYTQFLQPTGIGPRQQKQIETTDIMLVMVAHGRGVAALPGWLVEEYAPRFELHPIRLGKKGIAKQIFLGYRETDEDIHYLRNFIEFAATS